MNNTRIPKTLFLNLIRCNRYAALNFINKDKMEAIIDDSSLDELYNEEKALKLEELKRESLESFYEEDADDELDFNNSKIESNEEIPFLKQFNYIETLASKKIASLFGGKILAGEIFKEQKYLEYVKDGYKFYCFCDIYQEDNDTIRIIEVKASTDSKFLKIVNKGEPYLYKPFTNDIYYSQDDFNALDKNEPFRFTRSKESFADPFDKKGRAFYDLAFQRYLFEKNKAEYNPSNKKMEYYIAVLNSQYVFDGKMLNGEANYDPNQIISIIYASNITKYILDTRMDNDFNEVIENLNKADIKPVNISKHCLRKDPRECIFFNKCLIDNHIDPVENLYNFNNYHYGFKISGYDSRVDFYTCLNDDDLKDITKMKYEYLADERQKKQLDVILSNKYFIDKEIIKKWFDTELKYPLYHLDFESLPSPLPRFKGEKCYTQSLFQYSLHIEKSPGVCDNINDNISFLAKADNIDERYELAKTLCDNIKDDNGSVIVYNENFEKARLKELAALFPDLADKLMAIRERIVDLLLALKPTKELYEKLTGKAISSYLYYHRDLHGSFSIKKVLPIFVPSLSYKNLNVQNGVMAYTAFMNLKKQPTTEAYNNLYNDMLKYCMQDTYSMVLILKELRKIVFK